MSLRRVARQLGKDIRELREQEAETTDLRLSHLYQWQSALEVPLTDLLQEPDTPLSRPVMERARLLRMMKTVMAIVEDAKTPSTRRLAQTLANQLIEIMPELDDVGPWHSVGQRRSLNEYGRAAERCLSEEILLRPGWD